MHSPQAASVLDDVNAFTNMSSALNGGGNSAIPIVLLICVPLLCIIMISFQITSQYWFGNSKGDGSSKNGSDICKASDTLSCSGFCSETCKPSTVRRQSEVISHHNAVRDQSEVISHHNRVDSPTSDRQPFHLPSMHSRSSLFLDSFDTASSQTGFSSDDSNIFCPLLINRQDTFKTLCFESMGKSKPPLTIEPQEDEFIIKEIPSFKVLLHVLLSESGDHPGILLETSLNVPVGYISTGTAQHGPSKRYATIYKAISLDFNPDVNCPYAVVEKVEGKYHVKRVFGRRPPKVIHRVHIEGEIMNFFDEQGMIVGVKGPGLFDNSYIVQAYQNVDMGLMICSLIAAVKLS